MTSLTYVSSATHLFSNRDLVPLLAQWRDGNARKGITGMLLYKDGNFMQVLEGPPAVIRRQFLAIRSDFRHERVVSLGELSTESRRFPDWSLAFWNLNSIDPASVPGYADFADIPLIAPEFVSDPPRAQELMLLLRNSL
ncbi:MAG: BLUF domain-containing protein [Saprospiraceae bacterium]